jgi:hypothetical protein
VLKSHSTRRNHTLREEITLVREEITLVREEITLVREKNYSLSEEITFVRV